MPGQDMTCKLRLERLRYRCMQHGWRTAACMPKFMISKGKASHAACSLSAPVLRAQRLG
jgi:hypothetical protein